MEPAHSDAVSKALGVDPIMVCASDFGWISRPRLWWLYPSILQATVDPASGKPLLGETRVLSATAIGGAPAAGERPCGRRPPVPPVRGGGPAQVAVRHHAGRGRCRPPGTEEGRWAADSRRFAPWHYTEEAMMTDKAGKLHVVPAPVRERLHHIPAGYTDTPHLDDRARHRVLANGWHWGVAQRLLTILLAASTVHPAAGTPTRRRWSSSRRPTGRTSRPGRLAWRPAHTRTHCWPNSSRRPGWAEWWGPRGHRPAGTFTPRRF